jgi:ubiquinone/menaquinone biosynthesis C-methylase UbiE
MKQSFERDRKSARKLFNRVAFAFRFFEGGLFRQYHQTLALLDLPTSQSVLDVGTGTGILAKAFYDRGHPIKGIDISENMLKRARKKLPSARLEQMDLIQLNQISDNSYDITAISYVLHGLPYEFRKWTLQQLYRITRFNTLIFDYTKSKNPITALTEWIEGPHYFEYIQNPLDELLTHVGYSIRQSQRTRGSGRYWLCDVKRESMLEP